jgi:hypothetical protein
MRHNTLFFLTGICLLLSGCFSSSAYTVDLHALWTDGYAIYVPHQLNDSIWVFVSDYMHGAAFPFGVKVSPSGDCSIDTSYGLDQGHTLDLARKGDKFTYKEIEGHKIIIIQSSNGPLISLLEAVDTNTSLLDIKTKDLLRYRLSGVYLNPVNQQEVIFGTTLGQVSGLPMGNHYRLENHDWIPGSVMTFDNGSHLRYTLFRDTLYLYRAKPNGDGSWTEGSIIYRLPKLSNLDLPEYKGIPGKYPYATTDLLLEGMLVDYDWDEIRLMRNEMYARHGYRFKSPELKAYFGAQTWYKAQSDNVDDQLTPLEKLNVETIAHYQKENDH